MALRIQHDLWYIRNGSLWLDLKILLMTPEKMTTACSRTVLIAIITLRDVFTLLALL
jgi:lipopolysaccharide/colanic/teichoic acid biosynthesis glycosyltransferase